jgi:orotate phosphoribosyltransferase
MEIAAQAAIAAWAEAVFRAAGAYRPGHVLVERGRHGDTVLDTFALLSDPAATSRLCGYWAARTRAADGTPRIDVVVGVSTGGAVLAFETARQVGAVRASSGDVLRAAGGLPDRLAVFARPIEAGTRVLVVDVGTDDDAFATVLPLVEALGGEIVEIDVLVGRLGGAATWVSPTTGRIYPYRPLWRPAVTTYEPGVGTCPGCVAGLPLERADPREWGGVSDPDPMS